jgi:ribonucleoside-triphosphate reductase
MAISTRKRNNSPKKSLLPMLQPRSLQTTLFGEQAEDMPNVRTSDGFILPWNSEAIVKQLLRETALAQTFYGKRGMKRAEARRIADIVEKKIKRMDVHELSGPLIREFVNVVLLEEGFGDWARACSRVGTSLYDAYRIDHGEGFEAKENSNLTANPETSAKKKHDKLSKQQVLLMLPQSIGDAHRSGDFHIHDMEYANVRPFCADYDLRYFLYYGLMPDGTGAHASVAGPAKSPEVAILHAVKALAAGQTNCAGGQGFYNFLTFWPPISSTSTMPRSNSSCKRRSTSSRRCSSRAADRWSSAVSSSPRAYPSCGRINPSSCTGRSGMASRRPCGPTASLNARCVSPLRPSWRS